MPGFYTCTVAKGGGYSASLRARAIFIEPRASFASPENLPPKNPKKDIMPYCALYLYIQKRWPCNIFNCEPKSFCGLGFSVGEGPVCKQLYSHGDVLLFSVQNSAKFLPRRTTLKTDSSDNVDKK